MLFFIIDYFAITQEIDSSLRRLFLNVLELSYPVPTLGIEPIICRGKKKQKRKVLYYFHQKYMIQIWA